MILDRRLQHTILFALSEKYPDAMLVSALPCFVDSREFMANLFYLQEHGLLVGGDYREPGRFRSMVDIQITMKGLDFLTDDEGLPSILSGARINLDADEMVRLVQESLERGKLPESLLQMLKDEVAGMGMEQLQALLLGMVEEGAKRQDLLSLFFPDILEENNSSPKIREPEG